MDVTIIQIADLGSNALTTQQAGAGVPDPLRLRAVLQPVHSWSPALYPPGCCPARKWGGIQVQEDRRCRRDGGKHRLLSSTFRGKALEPGGMEGRKEEESEMGKEGITFI